MVFLSTFEANFLVAATLCRLVALLPTFAAISLELLASGPLCLSSSRKAPLAVLDVERHIVVVALTVTDFCLVLGKVLLPFL